MGDTPNAGVRAEKPETIAFACDACGEKVSPTFFTAISGKRKARWRCKCGAKGVELVG